MQLEIKPGSYVVAVSGGVDSVTLLDLLVHELQSLPGLRLTVAHFDHGIRADSSLDRQLVARLAADYGLEFVTAEGRLGPRASEAAARTARYNFLYAVKAAHRAQAIITAHHQDDVLETAIINLLRGSGRKGLTALASRPGMVRPLLGASKQQLLAYAREHGLDWREDSTNQDDRLLRNYVRHHLLSRFTAADRQQLLAMIGRQTDLNHAIDGQAGNYLHLQPAAGQLERRSFQRLPHAVAREIMAVWLREQGVRTIDRRLLERLVVAAKTLPAGKRVDVQGGRQLHIGRAYLALRGPER